MYDLLFVYRLVVSTGFFSRAQKTQKTLTRSKSTVMSHDGSQDLIVNMWTCLFTEKFYLDKYCFNLKRLNYYIILFICSLTIMISLGHRLESILNSPPPPYPFSIIDNSVKVIMSGDHHTLQEGDKSRVLGDDFYNT